MFFLRPPEAASKRTRVCFFGGEAAEKTHILFCARYIVALRDQFFNEVSSKKKSGFSPEVKIQTSSKPGKK